MACVLFCNCRASATRGEVNAGKMLILLGLWALKAGGRQGRGCRVLTLGSHNVDTLVGAHRQPVATVHTKPA
jgi:hypothetical protein